MKFSQLITIPFKTLCYGALIKYHTNKAKKYGVQFPSLLNHHRSLAYYYFFKAFGHMPGKKE